MDPHNPGPDEHGWADDYAARSAPGDRAEPAADGSGSPTPAKSGRTELPGGSTTPAPVRTVDLVAGEYLLTVNPLDGSEVEACPPGARPGPPPRRTPEERDELRRAALPPAPPGLAQEPPVLERDEERERLKRLLARGRSVRVTGPSGSGRSTLLDAVAADCAGLAPDGVVRLSGINRTPTELLYELFATVHDAPLHRPDRAALLGHVREIGAVVVLDDLEFGGSALDELLDATPECAFLLSATPDIAAPSSDAHLEEVFLAGLTRSACVALLAGVAQRALDEDEEAWAADLWFESEGLPLRFVQAGALLRQRDALRADPEAFGAAAAGAVETSPEGAAYGYEQQPAGDESAPDLPLPTLAEAAAPAALLASRMGGPARDALRYAVALGGECPHQAHLPALTGDTHADAAVSELLASGLISPVGGRYRLAAGVATQLENAGYAEDAAERAQAVARHYAWWAGHASVTPERAANEADAMLAAMSVLVSGEEPGQPSTAVLLARTAAPAFAAALHWGAWERALRHGQEAARIAGEVAEEAYFHHELGVLALCTGNLDRARAELDASIGLRGVLADRRGAVSGRRALALVADKAGGFVHGEGLGGAEDTGPDGSGGIAVPPTVSTAFGGTADTGRTVVSAAPGGTRAPGTPGDEPDKGLAGRLAVFAGTRRNVLAAGAGALLVAVLGTVVTLGATSGGDDGGPGPVTSEQSVSEEGSDEGFPGDRSTGDSTSRPEPGDSETTSGSPSTSASPSDEESGSESGEPTEPDDPESSASDDTEEPGGPGGGGHDPDEPTDEPSDSEEPTDEPSDPDEPTDEPTTPTPTPSDGESTSASSTASGPPSGPVVNTAGTGPAGTDPARETTAPLI